MEQSNPIYPDYSQILFKPAFAAQCLGLTPRTLKDLEEKGELEIRRMACGTVSARVYTLSDIFDIAAVRRSKGNTKRLARPMTISTYVRKGGTGKTTCCANLAMHLAFLGLRVLIVDNDPQADCTSSFGYDPDLLPEELADMGLSEDRAVYGHWGNLMALNKICPTLPFDSIIKKPFGESGPHIIPAEEALDDLDLALNASQNQDFRYAAFLHKARNGQIPGCNLADYDVIIFDNAPSGTLLTRNAMVASDMLLCPVRLDKFSYRALSRLANKLALFQEDYQRSPSQVIIPTMFIKNRPRAAENLQKLSEVFPGKVTNSVLYLSEDYAKALEGSLPVLAWKGASENSVGAMRAVCDEILTRLRELATEEQA